jgi:putative transposase
MVSTMKDKDVQDMVGKVAGEFKSEADFEAFTKALRKQFWESTLEGELDDHLGYEKHSARGNGTGNSRNGKSAKRIRSEHGELEIEAPRDRNGSFEPCQWPIELIQYWPLKLTHPSVRLFYIPDFCFSR